MLPATTSRDCDRHRRRLDGVHHRPRPRAGTAGVAPIGCVGITRRFFADGGLSALAFAAAETLARTEIESIAREFTSAHWSPAFASSGTALALAAILEENGLSAAESRATGSRALRKRMVGAGHVRRLRLAGLKPGRAQVLAGGLAIMSAALSELDVERIDPVGGALRLGVLYDLLGRTIHHDVRAATVEHFVARYRVDREHADRVARMAARLYRMAVPDAGAEDVQRLEWAARLHEVGFSVSHSAFHKHGAYILGNADMPGFGAREQSELASLVLGCRGGLAKVADALLDRSRRAGVLALRLAVLFHHARRPIESARLTLDLDNAIHFGIPSAWRRAHPLTTYLLAREREEWEALGFRWLPPRRLRDRDPLT